MTRLVSRQRNPTFPSLVNGAATIHHITDTHFGIDNLNGQSASSAWVQKWNTQTRDEMDYLEDFATGHVHTGDMINWSAVPDPSGQDAAYVAWRQAIKALDGKPWAEAVGNHDLGGSDGFSGGSSVNFPTRLTTEWETAMGMPTGGKNKVTTMGSMRIITVGPDTHWGNDTAQSPLNYTLSSATVTWLDQQLTAAGSTPCWIAAHIPLDEQVGGGGGQSQLIGHPELHAVLNAHTNAVGWLSGHLHTDIKVVGRQSRYQSFSVGSRRIFGINGPAAGGLRGQCDGANISMYVTYLGDAIDVRWRDHNQAGWTKHPDQDRVKHVLIT